MNDIVKNITSYLTYLNNVCKLKVSVHFNQVTFDCIPTNIAARILPFNSHTNAYCVTVKNIDHTKCLNNQREILLKCKKDSPFCHTCHAGVHEYIYPVFKKNEAVGFVAVSGYRCKNPDNNLIINRDLWEQTLMVKIPIELCNSVIPPLSYMLELMLETHFQKSNNEYNMIIQFLNEYHTNITLEDLAKKFNRSKSHISHMFKKESGLTIRAYCNNLKLEDSKELLANTNLPITEIAFEVGFNDVSHYIQLFKNRFGLTPLQFRRKSL